METSIKVLSIWQPWASLLIHGHKCIETRGWAAPRSLIGQRIGIASTSQVKAAQLAAYRAPLFQDVYATTGLEELEELPLGCFLGSVILERSELMDEDYIMDQRSVETVFGWFSPGRHGWHVTDPRPLAKPFRVRGAQGFWELPDVKIHCSQAEEGSHPAR